SWFPADGPTPFGLVVVSTLEGSSPGGDPVCHLTDRDHEATGAASGFYRSGAGVSVGGDHRGRASARSSARPSRSPSRRSGSGRRRSPNRRLRRPPVPTTT